MRIMDWSSYVCSSDLIGVIGLRLAQIPGDAAAADQRAGKTPRERVFLADRRDIDVALFEDAVVNDQAHRVAEQFGQARLAPFADVDEQFFGHELGRASCRDRVW